MGGASGFWVPGPEGKGLQAKISDESSTLHPLVPPPCIIQSCWSLHSAQRALLETPSSRRLSSQTKMTARRRSQRTKSIGKLAHVQASGHLEEQTPRTLLKNILLTAPESSIVMPESVVKPVPAPQVVQPPRRESSRGSLELQLPELEPPTTLAPGLLAPGKRKQRLRLSVFQQGMDQELPLSQEPHGNADASSLTSSLNLTFATPLQPQSVQRPGLARRPPTHRAVDVGAFLQDLRDTSLALAPPDTVLEDTQPFSQPLVGQSPSVHHSLPCPSHSGAEDAERAVSHRTRSSGPRLQNNSPGKPAQLLAGRAEEVDALAMSFSHSSSSIFGEVAVEPLQDGVGEEAEERMEESLSMSKVKEAARAQGSARAEEPEGHTQVTEAEGSQGAIETKEPEGSSGDVDTSGRTVSPELAASTPEFLQAKQLQCLEPAPPPSTAVLPLEPLSARLPPRARTPGPKPRQDPYKTRLSHYAKLFSFYAKMPMERKALEMVEKCLDKYFQHLCDDLEVFAAHAGRKTVRPEDLELLMRRQGLVTDQLSLHVLVERHLPLEYRQLLIPCAFSGNSVFPAQ
ncbi:PREDICTED: centromere protein T isoform X1 [Ceratotherium simum simum]|uniref:Centromere protein T n=1 Tax=Ceratotherium simum simum TaxID=73337 RepID=A0ABM1CWP4_CERSS|nr:PREDICTED: centromere protein T isoform X1 [Ceratotherium simum simum]